MIGPRLWPSEAPTERQTPASNLQLGQTYPLTSSRKERPAAEAGLGCTFDASQRFEVQRITTRWRAWSSYYFGSVAVNHFLSCSFSHFSISKEQRGDELMKCEEVDKTLAGAAPAQHESVTFGDCVAWVWIPYLMHVDAARRYSSNCSRFDSFANVAVRHPVPRSC